MLRCARTLQRTTRRHLCDGFSACWGLPYRQIPWALPFAVGRGEAIAAFDAWSGQGQPGAPKLKVRAVRPMHVPYYIFEGSLDVTYTGVVNYEPDGSSGSAAAPSGEYAHAGIRCPPTQLGADTGPTTAVYAGFDFRRLYVRQALSADLSDALLRASAVPFTELSGTPHGAGVEAFKMKPSFAYLNRIQERLPEIAYHEAERHMDGAAARGLRFERADGASVCPLSESQPTE